MKSVILTFLLLITLQAKADLRLQSCAEQVKKISLAYLDRAIGSQKASSSVQSYMQQMKKRLINTKFAYSPPPSANASTELNRKGIQSDHTKVYAYVRPAETRSADMFLTSHYTIHIAPNYMSVCKIDLYQAASIMLHETAHLTPNSSLFFTYFGECDADQLSRIVQVLATGSAYRGNYSYGGGDHSHYIGCGPKTLHSDLVRFYKSEQANQHIRFPIAKPRLNPLTPEEESYVRNYMARQRQLAYQDPLYETFGEIERRSLETSFEEYELALRTRVLMARN